MDYEVDLDPSHAFIRLTLKAEVLTLELAEEIHIRLALVTSRGDPYAAIFDLSG